MIFDYYSLHSRFYRRIKRLTTPLFVVVVKRDPGIVKSLFSETTESSSNKTALPTLLDSAARIDQKTLSKTSVLLGVFFSPLKGCVSD